MIFATTPSGKKLKPAVVIADRGPRAKKAFDFLASSVHFMWGYRWYGEDMWAGYVEPELEHTGQRGSRPHPTRQPHDLSPHSSSERTALPSRSCTVHRLYACPLHLCTGFLVSHRKATEADAGRLPSTHSARAGPTNFVALGALVEAHCPSFAALRTQAAARFLLRAEQLLLSHPTHPTSKTLRQYRQEATCLLKRRLGHKAATRPVTTLRRPWLSRISSATCSRTCHSSHPHTASCSGTSQWEPTCPCLYPARSASPR